jgi:methionine synthase I (cobalamin-dependent)
VEKLNNFVENTAIYVEIGLGCCGTTIMAVSNIKKVNDP